MRGPLLYLLGIAVMLTSMYVFREAAQTEDYRWMQRSIYLFMGALVFLCVVRIFRLDRSSLYGTVSRRHERRRRGSGYYR